MGGPARQAAGGDGVYEAFEAGDALFVGGQPAADRPFDGAAFEAFADVRADHLAVADAQALRFGFDAREQVGVKAAGRGQRAGRAVWSAALEEVSHAG